MREREREMELASSIKVSTRGQGAASGLKVIKTAEESSQEDFFLDRFRHVPRSLIVRVSVSLINKRVVVVFSFRFSRRDVVFFLQCGS